MRPGCRTARSRASSRCRGWRWDDVRVHYDSERPARVGAAAYAEGGEIHLGPGQEQHLPHEAWHVVQQAQGRVQPSRRLASGGAVNADRTLEDEAQAMGERAAADDVRTKDPSHADPSDAAVLAEFKLAKARAMEKVKEYLKERGQGGKEANRRKVDTDVTMPSSRSRRRMPSRPSRSLPIRAATPACGR